MTDCLEAVADLCQDCIAQVEQHRRLVQQLTSLAQLAAMGVGPQDIGQVLLAELGDETQVKDILQRQLDFLCKTFNQWHAAARLAANEGRLLK